MTSENHLGLPEEIFELILLELDLADLLLCAEVCIGWRNSVNSNRIWEKLCTRNIDAERLKYGVANRKLKCEFEEVESENFTQICPWRARYMHDVNLKRNWKSGSSWEEAIGYIEANLHDFETDYQVLLEPSMSRPSFNVYQLSPIPILSEIVYFSLQQPIPEFFKLLNNVLVVVQCTLLQVYTLDDDLNFNRPLVALFDKDHNHAKKLPDELDLSDWYSRTVGLYPCDIYVRCDQNGEYFVGMYNMETDFSDCYLHVWDLKSCTKIQQVSLPNIAPGERILDVTFSLHKNVLHLILKSMSTEFGTPYNSIHSYNMKTLKYEQTIFKVNYVIPFILFTDTLIVSTNFLVNKLFLNHFQQDSECLDTLGTSQPIDCRTVQMFGHILAYGEFDLALRGTTTVHVYNTSTMSHIDEFVVPRSVYSLHIFLEHLMLVGTPMLLHLRDIKIGSTIRTIVCLDFIPPDVACTKMIIEKPDGQLVLTNFW